MKDNSKKNNYICITPNKDSFTLGLKEVFQYKDLIVLFTKRNFQVRYKQTILGPAWLFINPIISSLIYCFIFGGVAGISTGEIPQMLFYMSGNAIWTFFASAVTKNASTFTANAAVFGKVYFPRLTTPISNILTSALEFAIQMILVFGFIVYYCFRGIVYPHWASWMLVPIILLHLGLMGMGVGIIISSLTTKYRDLSILVGFAVSLWMYITPVVYPLSQASDGMIKTVLLINPVTASVEIFRVALLGQGEVMLASLAWSWVFTVLVLFIGIVIFNRVERTFMDTV